MQIILINHSVRTLEYSFGNFPVNLPGRGNSGLTGFTTTRAPTDWALRGTFQAQGSQGLPGDKAQSNNNGNTEH